MHLVAATPNATYVEFSTDTEVLNIMELFATKLRFEDGNLLLPQEPGLGITLDDAAVERYSPDGWHKGTALDP